jgi:demethylmenaquinone methyltransferase/2-methoxy-6-polyprenyl-1,4-benzoquinol methylase
MRFKAYHLPMPESADKPAEPAWTDEHLADPHAAADKARRVQRMFGAIAGSYDLNNRLHSLWRDQAWRRKTVRLCQVDPSEVVLDVACGTGDLAQAFVSGGAVRVIGVDFTQQMLRLADRRCADAAVRDARPVAYVGGDAMRLPVADESVDIVSIAFGIRNVTDPAVAVAEFARVLRCGGRLAILEFSLPRRQALRAIYELYFRRIMPRTATWISRDRTGAYRYLPQSVSTFIDRKQMVAIMEQAGFEAVTATPLTFGIAVAYVGRRAPH